LTGLAMDADHLLTAALRQPLAVGGRAVVRIEGLSRVYRQDSVAVRALDGIDLEIDEGDFAVLVGPSGSGKTTLLNMIGALDSPTEGRIWVAGIEIGRLGKGALSELRLRRIGFVFQEFNLIPVLSALENVEFVMLLQGVPEARRRERSMALLEQLWLGGLEHRRPAELSGGQQQRVAVARAIAAEPSIVLLDEPTANLDSKAGAALMDLMRRLNDEKRITFVFSTHDPMVVERARRVIRLRDGRIEADERRP
jgi:putative ABC transport system ATP-binding protein